MGVARLIASTTRQKNNRSASQMTIFMLVKMFKHKSTPSKVSQDRISFLRLVNRHLLLKNRL